MSISSNSANLLFNLDTTQDDTNLYMTSTHKISVNKASYETAVSPVRRRPTAKMNFKNARQIEDEEDSQSDIETSEES